MNRKLLSYCVSLVVVMSIMLSSISVFASDEHIHNIVQGESSNENVDTYYCTDEYTHSIEMPKMQYPESEHSYSNSIEKEYSYNAKGATSLTLTFSENCMLEENYDFVYLYDNSGNIIGAYTGTELSSKEITIMGSGFSIILSTDHSKTYYGFSIDSISASYDDFDFVLPNYSVPESRHNYSNNENTRYYYSVPGADSLTLYFSSQCYTEKNYDFVTIYDGSNRIIGKYSGSSLSGKMINVKGNTVYIELTSDHSATYFGFALYFIKAKTKSTTEFANSSDYTLTVPNTLYPQSSHSYSNNIENTYAFYYPNAKELQITFSSSTRTEKDYDFISIYDGNGNLIGRHSGVALAQKTITIPTGSFKIVLTTDHSATYYGFSFSSIKAVCSSNVGRNNNETEQINPAIAPQTRHEYNNNSKERYYFTNALATSQTLDFSSLTNTEQNYDFITIYDGNNKRIGRYSGDGLADKSITIPTGSFSIELTTDASATYYGYSLSNIEATYEAQLSNKMAYPESNHSYGNHDDMEYYYEAPNKDVTSLFVHFSSKTKTESNYDFIYIYDSEHRLVGKYSGTELANRTVKLSGNALYITLISDHSATYYGFSIDSIVQAYATDYYYPNEIGHSFEKIGTIEPTTSTNGFDYYACTTCGETKLEDISSKMIEKVDKFKLYYYSYGIDVTWHDDSDVYGYEIDYSTWNDFRTKLTINSVGDGGEYFIENLKEGKEYFVRIRSYNIVDGHNVYSEYTEPLSMTVRSLVYTSTLDENNNNLMGKSMITFGTSIIEGGASSHVTFDRIIAQANDMSIVNKGLGGGVTSEILIDRMLAEGKNLNNYDYVLVEGFANDSEYSYYPIGNLTPDGTTEFNTRTYIGVLEYAINEYQQKGYIAKLCFVLTPELPEGFKQNQVEYWNAAISVFEKYNVPYINTYDLQIEHRYTDHPTICGHQDIATVVEPWLNSI